jgi:hypothetical protein
MIRYIIVVRTYCKLNNGNNIVICRFTVVKNKRGNFEW